MQYTPDQVAEVWQSLSGEEVEWLIVASCYGPFWTEPTWISRVATGVPNRVDRLKQLGNAVVPQIPEVIGRMILEIAA